MRYIAAITRSRNVQQQKDELRDATREINILKSEMHEIKKSLGKIGRERWQIDKYYQAIRLNNLERLITGTDVGDIADLQSASGIIASSTDVVEAIVALNSSINTLDVDIAGDSGTISILDTQTLTIAGTSGEIETVRYW